MNNEERFNELYNKYKSYVMYLLRSIYDNQMREDISQELWLVVWNKLPKIEENKEASFIRGCARNLIGNYISKQKGKEVMMDKIKMIEAAMADDDIAYFNLMDYLQSNLQEWEFDYIIYFIQGIRQQELAKYLGVPQSYVSKHMQMAIKHAREVLSGDYKINAVTNNYEHNNWVNAVNKI